MEKEVLLLAIAPCGIDCINCEVHEKNITPQRKDRIAQMSGKSPDEAACKGCRSYKRSPVCPVDCPTEICTREKGVDFCYECSSFPCDMLHPCADRADILPHNLKVFNLCRMRAVGPDKWLSEESLAGRARYYRGKTVIGKGPLIK